MWRMKFNYLLTRLAGLERGLPRGLPWPPREGSFTFLLWDRLGRPGERRCFMGMYLENAEKFYEEKK